MFEYVSAANLVGEIIEWFGFMIACNFSYISMSFSLFVVVFLGPRAVETHYIYILRFPNYPKRAAIIPFIY